MAPAMVNPIAPCSGASIFPEKIWQASDNRPR
jgi:hypothetical protein